MNKSIIVTGCTQGIGLSICNHFAGLGFSVAGCARNTAALKQMHSLFSQNYPEAKFYFETCDMTQEQAVNNFMANATEVIGVPDILVNNAGAYLPGQLLDEPQGQLERMIEVNLYSAYYASRAVLPQMIAHKKGHIFNMCSIASLDSYPNGGSYSISKFAMLGMSKQFRLELMDKGIKVTAIMPGAVRTPSWDGSGLPDSRFIPAADIASVIYDVYKLSPYTNVEEIIIRPQEGDI